VCAAPLAAQLTDSDIFEEKVLNPDAGEGLVEEVWPLDERIQIDPEPFKFRSPAPGPGYLLLADAGVTRTDTGFRSDTGGQYSVGAIFPVKSILGVAYGSANNTTGGSQYLGTLGLLAPAQYDAYGFLRRFGGGVLFHQYHDTRGDDFYVGSMRYSLTFAAAKATTLSLTYHDQVIHDSQALPFLSFQNTPTALTTSAEEFEAAVQHYWGRANGRLGIGWRNGFDVLTLNAAAGYAWNDQVRPFVNGSYQESGTWGLYAGVQFLFGPSVKSRSRRGAWQHAERARGDFGSVDKSNRSSADRNDPGDQMCAAEAVIAGTFSAAAYKQFYGQAAYDQFVVPMQGGQGMMTEEDR